MLVNFACTFGLAQLWQCSCHFL